ncbi:MAG TPA: hypothetical protein VGU70_13975 [Methylobacterium sp.]|jgi:hypothetical protein|uniref:hypothetical protein n=1 Tax=Methylorubrum sp. B1-46 TaxID=2897334 RepID=UPI001E338EF9|nr:hypothetical protein [Methylorubrum sp. B1-46]UGB26797.1 hypothetical protein LPC10_04105 [Methylorubrum sp. B1-46]HEV2543861.1 hypothetical protein [Methylobacterium sp.]
MIRFPFADARARTLPERMPSGGPRAKHLPTGDETSMTELFRFAASEAARHNSFEKSLHGAADFMDSGAA